MSTFELLESIFLHPDIHLAELFVEYGGWVYGLLFLVIFCETGLVLFPFLPGDSLLFVAGTLAAGSELDINTLLITLLAAAWLGNNTNYWIGYRAGSTILNCKRPFLFNRAAFDRTHRFYQRHGGKTIIIARFIPIVRTFAPFVAGVAKMKYRHFVLFDLFGGALWVGSLTLAGYTLGGHRWVREHLIWIIIGVIALSLMPPLIGWLRAHYSKKNTSHEEGKNQSFSGRQEVGE